MRPPLCREDNPARSPQIFCGAGWLLFVLQLNIARMQCDRPLPPIDQDAE
jgi:hypothetical protein